MAKDSFHWARITKHTRCGSYSKKVRCPRCEHVHEVWHFGWLESKCPGCGKWVRKVDYTVMERVK